VKKHQPIKFISKILMFAVRRKVEVGDFSTLFSSLSGTVWFRLHCVHVCT